MAIIKKRSPNSAGQLSTHDNASRWKSEYAAIEQGNRSANTKPKTQSHYLHVHDFGFSLVDEDTVDGIEVRINRRGKGISDYYVGLTFPEGETLVISENRAKPDHWSDKESTIVYGGPTDLWGRKFEHTQLNDYEFGVGIAVQDPTGSNMAHINSIEIVLYVRTQSNAVKMVVGGSGDCGYLFSEESSAGVSCGPCSDVEVTMDVHGGCEAAGSAEVSAINNMLAAIGGIQRWDTIYGEFEIEHHLLGNVLHWRVKTDIPLNYMQLRIERGHILALLFKDSKIEGEYYVGSVELAMYMRNMYRSQKAYVVFKPKAMSEGIGVGDFSAPEAGIKHALKPNMIRLNGQSHVSVVYEEETQDGSEVSGQSEHGLVVNIESQTSQMKTSGVMPPGVARTLAKWRAENWTPTSDVGLSMNPATSGGCNCSGSATVQVIANPETGVQLETLKVATKTSVATFNLTVSEDTSGGVQAEGQAVTAIGPGVSGGAEASGVADENELYSPTSEGGGFVSGTLVLQQIYEAYPKGMMDLSILATFSESFEGGAAIGGRARVERLKSLTPSKLGGRLANSASSHIYEPVMDQPLYNNNGETGELPEGVVFFEQPPEWCGIDERCENGAVLPKIVAKRQEPYLPPKKRQITQRDRAIANVS